MLALMGTALPAGAEDETHYCFGEQPTIKARSGATVEGTSGPDVIWGGKVIDGRGGDDVICSLNGRDEVYGGDGNDKIDAGDDQDTVEGGPGDDYLVGGNSYHIGWSGGEMVSYEHASGPVNVDLIRASPLVRAPTRWLTSWGSSAANTATLCAGARRCGTTATTSTGVAATMFFTARKLPGEILT